MVVWVGITAVSGYSTFEPTYYRPLTTFWVGPYYDLSE